jgi:hypothetical protein
MKYIRRVRTLARIGCIAFFFVCGFVSSSASQATESRVSIELEKPVLCQEEPVLATIRIENESPENLDLDLGGDGRDNLKIWITGPDGTRREGKRVTAGGEATFFGSVHLVPGGRYSETIVLSEWFTFDQIGRYEIDVLVRDSRKTGGRARPIGGSPVVLEVSAKDTRQLLLSSESLLARIQVAGSSQDALAAAAALRLVSDPMVVPLWGRLLANPAFRRTAALRLTQIGNKAAVEALASTLSSDDAEARSLAEVALQLIANQTSNPSVRADAQKALSH